VLKAGTWYLVANADGSRSPRTYRVSRVREAITLDETFERPDGFDLQAHWAAYQRDYARRIFRDTATVRPSPAGRELAFLLGPIVARAVHDAMSEPDTEGWARTTVPIESLRHALHALLQLGPDVEVLEPPELRALFATAARELAARYGH
jgi:predicted DNA-binding transcriptional regulator YafY